MQWLFGSGEGAASSIQAYRGFRDFALTAARSGRSVVLAEGASLTLIRSLDDDDQGNLPRV
jgi:hypothetical protein